MAMLSTGSFVSMWRAALSLLFAAVVVVVVVDDFELLSMSMRLYGFVDDDYSRIYFQFLSVLVLIVNILEALLIQK